MSTTREPTRALGVIRLTENGDGLTGSWGKGGTKEVKVTIDPDSILTGQQGFNLLQMRLGENTTEVAALVSINRNDLQRAIDELSNQLANLDREDSWTSLGSLFMAYKKKYGDFGDPIGAVLSFVPPRQGSEDVSSVYGYGLTSGEDSNNRNSAKIYGKNYMGTGFQLVSIFWNTAAHNIGVAIPLPKRDLLEQVIADLEAQLKAVKAKLEKTMEDVEIV